MALCCLLTIAFCSLTMRPSRTSNSLPS
jgi:hypothetical protein